MTDELQSTGTAPKKEVRFEYSPYFPEILKHCRASLLVSTYQAGKLLVIGLHEGKLELTFLNFEQAMGVASRPEGISIGSRGQVWYLAANNELASRIEPPGKYDACYLARQAIVTGNIQIHEMAWSGDQLWVVNTLFSCLCTLHQNFSFVPRWKPKYVSSLAAEDRCHLNGMAMRHGKPTFASAMSETDTPAGWRPTKTSSGVVIDVESQEILARGLAMPHSPRWYDEKLWILDSGHGNLSLVNLKQEVAEPVVQLPGYTRGLAFSGQFAFVGLSRIRETAVFGGVPIQEQFETLKCGIAIVDLATGKNVAAFQFHSGVEEIFDVQVIPGVTNPILIGPDPIKDESQTIWVVPPLTSVADVDAKTVVPVFSNSQPLVAQDSGKAKSTLAGSSGRETMTMMSGDPRQLLQTGIALHEQGRLQESVEVYRQAIAIHPSYAEAWNNLGNVFQDLQQRDQALDCYRRAIQFQPNFVHSYRNLGYVLKEQGRIDEGLAILQQAQSIEPNDIIRYVIATSLPPVYQSVDDLNERRRRLEANVAEMAADGVKIDITKQSAPTMFYAAYQGLNDRNLQIQLASLLKAPQPLAQKKSRPLGKKIRLGMISRHYRNHTIGRLNVGTVEHLPRDRFEVFVISVGNHDDLLSRAFAKHADHHLTLPTNLETIRAKVIELDLDILFFSDVGMDTLTYSLSMSRLAPVQCVTWGHPETTGSPVMDYFVSSKHLEIPDSATHYSEKLLKLDRLNVFYHRPEQPVKKPREYFGLNPNNHIYLCFQNLFKMHPEFDLILAGILRSDPLANIVMMHGQHPEWTAMLQSRFARTLGADANRIIFLPGQSHADFMSLYSVADVSLDPIHFGGGNTTYEALAIGLPVVTWPSDFLRCRLSYAMYKQMGLLDCVVHSADEYVACATKIAMEPDYREELKKTITERSSVLFNDRDTIRQLGKELEQIADSTR